MAKQYSLSQWLVVSGATHPCKKDKVDSNTEDHHSCLNQVGQSEFPGRKVVY